MHFLPFHPQQVQLLLHKFKQVFYLYKKTLSTHTNKSRRNKYFKNISWEWGRKKLQKSETKYKFHLIIIFQNFTWLIILVAVHYLSYPILLYSFTCVAAIAAVAASGMKSSKLTSMKSGLLKKTSKSYTFEKISCN